MPSVPGYYSDTPRPARMTIGLFIRRLLVFVILLCLLPTGTWEAMNGGNHPPSEAHDPRYA